MEGRNKILIRPAKSEDIPHMIELWKEYMEFHKRVNPLYTVTDDAPQRWSEFVAEHIAAEQSCVLVAESGPELVGMCLSEVSLRPPVMRNPTYGVILDLAVTERSRRRGIGTLLFEKTKAWFGEHGIHRIELRVLTDNPVASAFWERTGFRTYIEVRYLDV